MWRPFRDFVLAADLRLMTGIQAGRFAGLGFLALYANGVLPGSFALPAGLGDMAIGVTAPWVLLALIRRPGFAAGKTFRDILRTALFSPLYKIEPVRSVVEFEQMPRRGGAATSTA